MLFKLNPITKREATKSVNNYRGIYLFSCVGKTYERVLRARIAHLVEKAVPLLDDAQNGFRQDKDTMTHIIFLTEGLQMGGNNTITCCLDIKKAFPTVVRRSSMMRALYDAGVCGKCWAAVASLFEHNRSVVKIHDEPSDE